MQNKELQEKLAELKANQAVPLPGEEEKAEKPEKDEKPRRLKRPKNRRKKTPRLNRFPPYRHRRTGVFLRCLSQPPQQ